MTVLRTRASGAEPSHRYNFSTLMARFQPLSTSASNGLSTPLRGGRQPVFMACFKAPRVVALAFFCAKAACARSGAGQQPAGPSRIAWVDILSLI